MKRLNQIRRKITETAYKAGEGHIASSLSIVEILYVLYNKILTEDDCFILSKGHASLGWYAVLNQHPKKLLTDEELESFCQNNSCLPGHPDREKIAKVNPSLKFDCASTGSLGHGLAIGVGMALGITTKHSII